MGHGSYPSDGGYDSSNHDDDHDGDQYEHHEHHQHHEHHDHRDGYGQDSYAEPYGQQQQQQPGQVQTQGSQGQPLKQHKGQRGQARVKRAGHTQAGARALDDVSAVPDGTLSAVAPGISQEHQLQQQPQQQGVQAAQLQQPVLAPLQQQQPLLSQQQKQPQSVSQLQQQQPVVPQQQPKQQQSVDWNGARQSVGTNVVSPGVASAPAPSDMGGFALRRSKKALAFGGVRAAAVASVSAAEELDSWQQQQQQQGEQQLQQQQQQQQLGAPKPPGLTFWLPEVQPASSELFDSSRGDALREALAKAELHV
jgi:hypothetical protein